MRRVLTVFALLYLFAGRLIAAPEGADLTLPSSTDRYIPGLISGEEAEVDRRMEVTEREAPKTAPEPEAKKSRQQVEEEGEGFFSRLFQNQTVVNLIILGILLGIFILHQLRSGGSRR
jgi:hypothetical protein